MDPLACWQRYLDVMGDLALSELTEPELHDARDALAGLSGWLQRGGFRPPACPSLTEVLALAAIIRRTIALRRRFTKRSLKSWR